MAQLVFDLGNEDHVLELAQSLAWHIPSLVERLDDVDETILVEAFHAVVSDIVKREMAT